MIYFQLFLKPTYSISMIFDKSRISNLESSFLLQTVRQESFLFVVNILNFVIIKHYNEPMERMS